jgi:hypothetical protein
MSISNIPEKITEFQWHGSKSSILSIGKYIDFKYSPRTPFIGVLISWETVARNYRGLKFD